MAIKRGRTSKCRQPGGKTRRRDDDDEPEPVEPPRMGSSTKDSGKPLPDSGFGACEDDLDAESFDPNARDFLGDFGLDDEETVPEVEDFWFDDADRFDD